MQVRPAVLTALAFSTIAFILGLLALLAGIPGFMEYAAVLRFDYTPYSPATHLPILSNPPSPAWGSIHLLSVCTGDWLTDPDDSTLSQTLTQTTNIKCYYTKDGLLNGKPMGPQGQGKNWGIAGMACIVGLAMQLIATGTSIVGLILLVPGKRHLNKLIIPLLFNGVLGAIIASIAGSAYALNATHTTASTRAPIVYSPVWIGMLWTGFFCTLIANCAEHVERNFERFTPLGSPISNEHKPKEVPVWVWNPWLKRAAKG